MASWLESIKQAATTVASNATQAAAVYLAEHIQFDNHTVAVGSLIADGGCAWILLPRSARLMNV